MAQGCAYNTCIYASRELSGLTGRVQTSKWSYATESRWDPYSSSMVSIWQLYGLAILIPYAYHTAGIWQSHMPAVWY